MYAEIFVTCEHCQWDNDLYMKEEVNLELIKLISPAQFQLVFFKSVPLCHNDSVIVLPFRKHTGKTSESCPHLCDHDLIHNDNNRKSENEWNPEKCYIELLSAIWQHDDGNSHDGSSEYESKIF